MKRPKKMQKSWSWKSSARFPKDVQVPAGAFGAVIDKIMRENNGEVTDQRIVDEGRPENSPTHGLYEWDDGVAAEAHRRTQAGYYRRHVLVVVQSGKKPVKSAPRIALVSTKTDDGKRAYRDAVEVMSDQQMRVEALDEAMRLLMGIRKRFSNLRELSEVFKVIDSFVAEYGPKIGSAK